LDSAVGNIIFFWVYFDRVWLRGLGAILS